MLIYIIVFKFRIKALIQQWKRRILTPFGRVTVVKTSLLPKLNHHFISLPNREDDKESKRFEQPASSKKAEI